MRFFFCTYTTIFLAVGVSAGDDPNDMFNKSCPTFRCSKGFTPVPKLKLRLESTGCGGMGSGMIAFSPSANANDDGNTLLESCCDQLHACYQICGISKTTCDETFQTCSKEACSDDEECKKSSSIYSMLLSLGGCKTFDQTQYASCDCASTGQVAQRREKFIQDFYKRHAPDHIDKYKKLVEKADTTTKMAGLMQKLIAKYPSCIKKVENPNKAIYDELRKSSKEKTIEDETDDENPAQDSDEKVEL